MNAAEFAEQLHEAPQSLDAGIEVYPADIDLGIARIVSYADGGYWTDDAGFVVTGDDGSPIHVTVRQSRHPTSTPDPDPDSGDRVWVAARVEVPGLLGPYDAQVLPGPPGRPVLARFTARVADPLGDDTQHLAAADAEHPAAAAPGGEPPAVVPVVRARPPGAYLIEQPGRGGGQARILDLVGPDTDGRFVPAPPALPWRTVTPDPAGVDSSGPRCPQPHPDPVSPPREPLRPRRVPRGPLLHTREVPVMPAPAQVTLPGCEPPDDVVLLHVHTVDEDAGTLTGVWVDPVGAPQIPTGAVLLGHRRIPADANRAAHLNLMFSILGAEPLGQPEAEPPRRTPQPGRRVS